MEPFESIAQVPGGGRYCPRCTRILALAEFAANATTPSGFANWCRTCSAADQRERRRRRRVARKASA